MGFGISRNILIFLISIHNGVNNDVTNKAEMLRHGQKSAKYTQITENINFLSYKRACWKNKFDTYIKTLT